MLKKIYEFVRGIFRKASQDSLPAYAAQAAFFVVLSFFPFVMLLIMITSKITFATTNIISYIIDVVPKQLNSYVLFIADDIVYSNSNSFTIITIIISLWSSAKVIQTLTYGLNKIYGINKKNNYLVTRLVSTIYTLIFVLICLSIMIIHIFGTAILKHIAGFILPTQNIGIIIAGAKNIFLFVILCILLLLIYYQLPDRKSCITHEISGAFAASLSWMLMTKGFTFYIKHIASASYMYGGLTSIILVFIWLYIGMQIVLYGAMINYYFGDRVEKYIRGLKINKEKM